MAGRPLAPQQGSLFSQNARSLQGTIPARNRKASFACLACKQRKSKCCQSTPCKLCQIHRSACIYDESADQRRRLSRQRLLDEYQSQRVSLHGIIAVIRARQPLEIQKLLTLIQSETPLPQLSSYVEHIVAASPELSDACQQLALADDDGQGTQLLKRSSEDSTQLVRESGRLSGLPRNAQVILGP